MWRQEERGFRWLAAAHVAVDLFSMFCRLAARMAVTWFQYWQLAMAGGNGLYLVGDANSFTFSTAQRIYSNLWVSVTLTT